MTDYNKKTNAELIEMLKSRSLAHNGRKAELVARLQADDEAKSAAPGETTATKADAAEDVIDWEDDAPTEAATTVKPSTATGAAAIAAGGQGPVANPAAVPNQKVDTDPSTTDDLKVESQGAVAGEKPAESETATDAAAAADVAESKPAVDYTRGLPSTELEEELKKRKARAEKFGIVEDTETALAEAEKALQRAKRFGTGAGSAEGSTSGPVGVKGLDEALPDERSRKRGRGDQEPNARREGKKRDVGGRNRNRRRGTGNPPQNQSQSQNQNQNKSSGQGSVRQWSEKDSLALEARKKRFATTA
ncbi:hypothetical protein ASPZODRAFT_132232 [Penicilliopsis zonata CBS 506.65]|uniref:SAP domain-containing protein n=1 Tax=Penicilliopsis zonata CBS 506.65 TaxID=1073090 RepID=A0A1L9SJC1_9EURO|nr:hypothetical protein ASPZODRAFT_132232 [Penicilliopsis zonata CBS 506.65]OJJ47257.1 hypothetical protein ASPZODRAFT_132232 [Penicilliopsis zonata CBS 506.65]